MSALGFVQVVCLPFGTSPPLLALDSLGMCFVRWVLGILVERDCGSDVSGFGSLWGLFLESYGLFSSCRSVFFKRTKFLIDVLDKRGYSLGTLPYGGKTDALFLKYFDKLLKERFVYPFELDFCPSLKIFAQRQT